MFGKKTEKKVIVKTKEELKAAVKRKEPCIEVQGDLANKMKWMGKLSKVQIAAFIPLLSTAALNPLAADSVVMIQSTVGAIKTAAVICLLTTIGSVTIIAIYKGYDVDITIDSMTIRLIRK